MTTNRRTGQISAVFNTGQICIKYRVNAQVFGVYRGRVENCYGGVALGDWVTFISGDALAKDVRRLDRDPAPVLQVDFKLRKLVAVVSVLVMLFLSSCSLRETPKSCTLVDATISCPDGTSYTIPSGIQGVPGTAGSTTSVVLTTIPFPDLVVCVQLNFTTWAKRTAATNINLYALGDCSGSILQSLGPAANELYFVAAREIVFMDSINLTKLTF